MGKDQRPCPIGKEAGKERGPVGQEHGEQQHAARPFSDVRDGGDDQPHDDERDNKGEKLTEYAVECDKHTYSPGRQHMPHSHSQEDGQDDAGQQSDSYLFLLHHSVINSCSRKYTGIMGITSRDAPTPDFFFFVWRKKTFPCRRVPALCCCIYQKVMLDNTLSEAPAWLCT